VRLIRDLLAHKRNKYWRFFHADIKHYLSLRRRHLLILLISRTLPFGLNVTLASVFNFTVLLSYRAIRVFLAQKFSCPVATHGHEPSNT
jgi:hypothetical protein